MLGFSFTNSEEGYAKTQDDVARDVYEALLQFFTVFPEFIARDFYIAGQSYAGEFSYIVNLLQVTYCITMSLRSCP